ncbi:TPA: ATP-binding protein [Vibrio vulnificus]|uniref:AAA family ATPase n=1 Tax=Vibrio vulnificus TaxID=672 RepID=UPI000314D83C|nr:ATP-binding protein [Vibrio vulnificus]EJB0234073.1 ATP-binding protein [Vibrio vulnificus]MCA3976766.1 ATP-binding protein [Vibrio vulnificus]MCA4003524.1 ATP-binding protein [Vibrio vulnificus]HAS8428282.1 ATP-binding protein [Vibrio vulnificus]HAS8597840.1 ATP-binding protein [Vibrio vulnificus]
MSSIEDWKLNNPYFIDTITVKGLLSRYDIEWNLSDVNVLVGKNGSGKSTIFKLAQLALTKLGMNENDSDATHKSILRSVANKFKSIEIRLNNGLCTTFSISDTLKEKENLLSVLEGFISNGNNFEDAERFDENLSALKALQSFLTNYEEKPNVTPYLVTGASDFIGKNKKNNFEKNVSIDFISTFDMLLLSQEKYDEASKKSYSQLDSVMRDEANALKSNLLKMSNHTSEQFQELEKTNNNKKLSVLKNNNFSQVNIFKKVVNGLFKDEGKVFDINESGDIVVKYRDLKISLSELSSGEKQLLIILLKVLNNSIFKPCIIFMDEPEISLHVSWQNKLIESIRRIAPNSQIIIVSHSPAVVMKNWLSKLVDIKDIAEVKK